MRASTPDTVIIIGSDDEKEDEAKEVVSVYFQDSVGRPAVGDELIDLARYTIRHPGVISAANEKSQWEVIARGRAEARVVRLQENLREAQADRVRLHRQMAEMKRDMEKANSDCAALREQRGRRAAAALRAEKRAIGVLKARVTNRDATIKRLRRELTEKALVDPRIEELGDELLRKNFLLQQWREHAKELEKELPPKRTRVVGEEAASDNVDAGETRPGSADSGRESAEPRPGPSSGRTLIGGLAPHAVRSMIAAQQDEDADDDITLLAENIPRVPRDQEPQTRPRLLGGQEFRNLVITRCSCGDRTIVEEPDKKDEEE